MNEKKTRFVVWNDDYYGNCGRKILAHVNTFAEAQRVLVDHWKSLCKDPEDREKTIQEILSHTEEEFVGLEQLTLYGSNCYFAEGIARVEGYVEDNEKESSDMTLGEILKRELSVPEVHKWNLQLDNKVEDSYLHVEGQNKVYIGKKYEHIVGLPTHHVDDYRVYSGMGKLPLYENSFPDVDWNEISVEEINNRLTGIFLAANRFYSEQDAINSLPHELVLDKGYGTQTIRPYDEYGYHIEQISAYSNSYGNGQGVFIYIKKG